MGKNYRLPEKVTCPIRVTMTKASLGIHSIAFIKYSSRRALKQQSRDRIHKRQIDDILSTNRNYCLII